jgi:hypothetical protein
MLLLNTQNFNKEEIVRIRAPVAHAYNPSCSGGRDQEDHNLKTGQKSWCEPASQQKKLDVVVCTCHLLTMGNINGRISMMASLGRK